MAPAGPRSVGVAGCRVMRFGPVADGKAAGPFNSIQQGRPMRDVFIGLDFGTDSVRAALISAEGEMIAAAVQEYPRWKDGWFCDASSGQFRQHPLDYLEAMTAAVRTALAEAALDPAWIAGIGVDTTGSTPCAVDAAGVPLALRPDFQANPNAMFVLWKDHTANAEADRINEVAHNWSGVDYTSYSGGTYSSEWFWSKLLHVLRHDRAVRDAAAGFVEHCDWITAALAGAPVRPGRCAAGHKAMWHASWGGLPGDDFLRAVDPLLAGWRDRLYQDTYTADLPVGTLAPTWAERLGLTSGVVVAGGAIDCHVGAVGAGIVPGQMVKVMGTSTCDVLVAPKVGHCVRGICGQVDGSVLPGLTGLEAGQSAFGDVYAWFRRFLGYGGDVDFARLTADAELVEPGAVLALDWLNGRRSPDANPRVAGALAGLNLGTTPPMVFRALVEATAFGSRAILERFREEGIAVDGISAVGGIARKSPFVMQICADVLQVTLRIVTSKQACALGAAMFAATASGFYPDVMTAMARMGSGFDAVYEPRPDLARGYDRLYQRYRALGAALEK